MTSVLLRITFALGLCLAGPEAVSAHELCLKAEKRDNRLYVEAWYDNDTPADAATVRVLLDGRVVKEGKTDERGVWTTDCPAAGKYRLRATDGGGHQAEIDFDIVASGEPQQAGTTKEEVSQRRWTGALLGLAVVGVLTLAGRWFLKQPTVI
jgi:hypothetical protein